MIEQALINQINNRYDAWVDDSNAQRMANRLMSMTREQIEAEHGPMTDEEYNEVFGAQS